MRLYKDSIELKLFLAYIIIVPCIYRNWLGIAVGFAIFLAINLWYYLRSVMTSVLYEKVLTLICILSLTSTSCAIFEKIAIVVSGKSHSVQRIAAAFLHPNYFGTIIATVIIICAYKIITHQGQKWFYYGIGLMNVISLYLCESMFAWVEIFLGIAFLLFVYKQKRLLAIWICGAVFACFIIFVLNIKIIPRLSDMEDTISIRLKIWESASEDIKHSPLFGHGFMSYLFIHKNYYDNDIIPHTHSLYLDMLMNFGLVGTVLFLINIIRYYKQVIKVCFEEKKTLITSLILALAVAAIAHGVIDITLMWIQTLPLFLVILSGFGIYEKSCKIIKNY